MRSRGRRQRALWTFATLVTLADMVGMAACSGPDTETSVYLEIYDPTVVASPTDVTLDVFDGAGGGQIATLHRAAVAQTSSAAPLGSVVILAGANAALGTLHIEGQRASGGTMLSEGSVDVPLVANRQVSARLALGRAGGSADAGTGAGGSSGGGAGGSASGAGGTTTGAGGTAGSGAGAGGSPGDAGTSPTDSGTTLAANGDDCRSAGACASGFCVDGVCCNSACDTLCHGCNLSGARGKCTAFAAGSQCQPPSCTANDSLIPARTCDANGNCQPAGATQSCGRYRCQNDACLRSCSSSNNCVSSSRCSNNRCQ